MIMKMAQHRHAPSPYVKDEAHADSHHPHHSQGPPPPQHIQHPRPSSIVHQQHHQAPSQQSQHHSAYSSNHSIQSAYQPTAHASSAQHSQDLPYYPHQQSPYSTPSATSGYTSADTSDMMAATQMPRPYPPISYHTPQSNSPASVASPSGHDGHRSLYAQPPSQLQHQSMYYSAQQPQYSSMAQQAPSPYQQHTQQSHQSMTSQPGMMMSQNGPMAQHPAHHSQSGMTGSPRHTKTESQVSSQIQRPSSGPLGTPQPNQNGNQLSTPSGPSTPGINNNAAPGPIPATTPLVVRQDNNGVQWIAFEYSRDRVKMEYTIRCDVESVNADELGAEFKNENCVYPRACCPKEQYRGNRLQYETECNTVGWSLAQLNPCLRGKRGLIQRAVDSWRNSNQDPRLRSRRVRRMAKMNNRKAVQTPQPPHMSGPTGPPGIHNPVSMGPGPMGKPSMGGLGPQLHHHHHEGSGQGGGDEVGDGEYMDDSHHHHHQPSGSATTNSDDVRPAHVFSNYPQQYPGHASSASSMPPMHDGLGGTHGSAIAARRGGAAEDNDTPEGLFPDLPEGKRRKFILVEDAERQGRLRVRVNIESVDTKEIPDSFRKATCVYPRSYFPREMQSPPPSATGSRFFSDDLTDDEVEVDGGRTGRSRDHKTRERVMVKALFSDGSDGEIAIPRVKKGTRGKEVRLNEIGYRIAWRQGRAFSTKPVFLQRAMDSYRSRMCKTIEDVMQDVKVAGPHFETRVGKRRWSERMQNSGKREDDA